MSRPVLTTSSRTLNTSSSFSRIPFCEGLQTENEAPSEDYAVTPSNPIQPFLQPALGPVLHVWIRGVVSFQGVVQIRSSTRRGGGGEKNLTLHIEDRLKRTRASPELLLQTPPPALPHPHHHHHHYYYYYYFQLAPCPPQPRPHP